MALWGLIVDYFTALTNLLPRFGFYPEPENLIVVVKEGQEDNATQFFAGLNFKVVTGTQYLEGYVGSKEQQSDWLDEKVEAQDKNISWMTDVARHQPQVTCIGLQHSLQTEWLFVQCVTAYT